MFTVGGEDFGHWAQRMQDNRNNRMAQDNNLVIDIDPEIKKVFDLSKNISSKYSFVVAICCASCLTLLVLYSWPRLWPPSAQGRVQAPTH